MNRAYSKSYQRTHDIDWFVKYNGRAYHFASNGGEIPSEIKRNQNVRIQCAVEQIEATPGKVRYQYPFADLPIAYPNCPDEWSQNYLVSFEEMAAKGFISVDNFNPESFEKHDYRVVAYPDPEEGNGNPGKEIMDMLPEVDLSEYAKEILEDYYRKVG